MKLRFLTPLVAVTVLWITGCNPAPVSESTPDSGTEAIAPIPSISSAPGNGSSETSTTAPTKAEQAQDARNFTVIPGERVGEITANTSHADLVQMFGEEALSDQEVHVGEGFVEPGTRVDLGEGRSLSVLWSDDSRTQVAEVRDFGSAWTLPQGVGVGTDFAKLQEVLGSFQLYGFGWDYGGTLSLEGTPLAAYQDLLVLRVQPEADLMTADHQAVMGEQMLSDRDPNLRSLNLHVSEMIVYLNPQ